MNLDLSKIEDIEFDGINHEDYPDFCDAFISSATYQNRDMTEEELEVLDEEYRDWVYEKLMDYLH